MIIGITGGIASGKTIVSDYVSSLGYPIVDADVLARKIMAPESPVLAKVVSAFGDGVINEEGALNRKALAARIFQDDKEREVLDGITHPAIRALAKEEFSNLADEPIVFFVVPLLYESDMDDLCDDVWLVHAEEAVRRNRLSKRDGIDEAYAQKKINAQMSESERMARGPKVLHNDGDIAHLHAQVESFLKKSKKLEKRC